MIDYTYNAERLFFLMKEKPASAIDYANLIRKRVILNQTSWAELSFTEADLNRREQEVNNMKVA